jgi:hypothetical protein
LEQQDLALVRARALCFSPQPTRIKQFAMWRRLRERTPDTGGGKFFSAPRHAAALSYPARRLHFRDAIDKVFT